MTLAELTINDTTCDTCGEALHARSHHSPLITPWLTVGRTVHILASHIQVVDGKKITIVDKANCYACSTTQETTGLSPDSWTWPG